MNEERKKFLRSIIFRHLDGIAICSPIASLHSNRIIDYIQKKKKFSIQEILNHSNSNAGYLNISLRLLASQGWIKQEIIEDGLDIKYNLTKKGKNCIKFCHDYKLFAKFIPKLIKIEEYLFDRTSYNLQNEFKSLFEHLKSLDKKYPSISNYGWEVSRHLEGMLIGPILTSLGMTKFFNLNSGTNQLINIQNIINKMPLFSIIFDFFIYLGWINKTKKSYYFSKDGIFFLKRASAYGVTVSYLPTFKNINELIFGNPKILWEKNIKGQESHVNRRMNVWGSGGAHSLYFKKIDEIITKIFNKPLDEQPIGIADMGCGDGTLLRHLFQLIKNNTKRGENLDIYPLKIIGADYNKTARLASTITLKDANIEHTIVHGDISNPADFATKLKNYHDLNLNDMLSVRSFLDHNRIYKPPIKKKQNQICNSSGAFAYRGHWIPNNELKQNLIEHFNAWTRYISKYGLLILELHTIPPNVTANNLGKTVATAYDATHGYTDQYILEADIMLDAAKEAGLYPIKNYETRFPSKNITTISINLLCTDI